MAARKKPPAKPAPRRKPDTAAQRQERMIEAAVREFALRGFAAASTNAMAEHAGVAKGLLFHHFGSKEALFTAAFDHVVEDVAARMFQVGEPLPKDLFERVFELGMRKLRIFQEAPLIYAFVTTALTDAPEAVRQPLMMKYRQDMASRWPELLDGVDARKLRKGISVQDALETMMFLVDGFERGLVQAMRDRPDHGASMLPTVTATVRTHMKRLRDGLYR